MLRRLLGSDSSVSTAGSLYGALIARAREPVFHIEFAVPDTIDGRFDLLALHGSVLMDALKPLGGGGARLGTALASAIFTGFDDALRELGVSDFGLSRRMKAMASAFYGRLEAYGAARSQVPLRDAILRNLYRGEMARQREADRLAHYIVGTRDCLAVQAQALLEGRADFGPLPTF